LENIESEFADLTKFFEHNDFFARPLAQLFSVQRAFHQLERHYLLNYHDFINDFQNTAISLDLVEEIEDEPSHTDLVFGDDASDMQEISFEKKTMIDLNADDAKQIIEEFKILYFLKLYRYMMFCFEHKKFHR